MKNILEYKGYYAKIEFNADDKILYGKIEGVDDLITFESDNASKIEEEFHNAVDDYIEFCEEVGKSPQKAYKGTFNIRISPQLHKEIALKALQIGETLNQTVENAIIEYLKPISNEITELYTTIRYDNVYQQALDMWNKYCMYSSKKNKDYFYDSLITYSNSIKTEGEVDSFVRF